MTMQSGPESGGFIHSVAGQMALMGIVIVVILLVAWRYVF
jgi:hypothetical protein